MNKFFSNERGLTLIELLAATVLTILISFFAFGVLIKGIQHYNIIATDTAFRDEADILMSSLVKDLYTTKESQITKTYFPQKNTKNYYFETDKTGTALKTGFINNELHIQGKVVSFSNTSILITDNSTIKMTEEGIYEVTLELHMPVKKQTVQFVNEIRTINDINEDKEED